MNIIDCHNGITQIVADHNHIERCHARHKKVARHTKFTLKEIRYSWCCVAELEGILRTGLDYWTGLLEWTTG